MLRWQTAGESHGEALVAMIEGLPAGIHVTTEDIVGALARRRLGYGRGARMKVRTGQGPHAHRCAFRRDHRLSRRHRDRQYRMAEMDRGDERRSGLTMTFRAKAATRRYPVPVRGMPI